MILALTDHLKLLFLCFLVKFVESYWGLHHVFLGSPQLFCCQIRWEVFQVTEQDLSIVKAQLVKFRMPGGLLLQRYRLLSLCVLSVYRESRWKGSLLDNGTDRLYLWLWHLERNRWLIKLNDWIDRLRLKVEVKLRLARELELSRDRLHSFCFRSWRLSVELRDSWRTKWSCCLKCLNVSKLWDRHILSKWILHHRCWQWSEWFVLHPSFAF